MMYSEPFTQNEDNSLVLTPHFNEFKKSQIINTFTGINLMDVFYLKSSENSKIPIEKIDIYTMLQNFNGLTFFQIFKSNNKFVEFLEKEIKKLGLKKEFDENGEKDNIIIRKLYWILKLPVISEQVNLKAIEAKINRPSII